MAEPSPFPAEDMWTLPNPEVTSVPVDYAVVKKLGRFASHGRFTVLRHEDESDDGIDVLQSELVTSEGILIIRQCRDATPIRAPGSIISGFMKPETYMRFENIDGEIEEWRLAPGSSMAQYSSADSGKASANLEKLVNGLPERRSWLGRFASHFIKR